MLMQVHAALFPNVRLLAVSERYIRSATLILAVTLIQVLTYTYTIVA